MIGLWLILLRKFSLFDVLAVFLVGLCPAHPLTAIRFSCRPSPSFVMRQRFLSAAPVSNARLAKAFELLPDKQRRSRWKRNATSLLDLSCHPSSSSATLAALFSSLPDENPVVPPPPSLPIPPSKASLYQEFKTLSLEIRKHDDLYYNLQQVDSVGDDYDNNNNNRQQLLLSDDDFDALVRREEALSAEHPDLLRAWQDESGWGVEATRMGRVGAKTTTPTTTTIGEGSIETDVVAGGGTPRTKRRHLSPMLSLDNVNTNEQLWAWLKRVVKTTTTTEVLGQDEDGDRLVELSIITEPKLDGVSLSLRYELVRDENDHTMELKWASTRGDGKVGQDVTGAVLQMSNAGIPRSIGRPDGGKMEMLEVRGEVVLPRSDFSRLQAKAKEGVVSEDGNEQHANTTIDNAAATPSSSRLSLFSNARNVVSGLLMRKSSDSSDGEEASAKLRSLLKFYAYDVGFGKDDDAFGGMNGDDWRNQLKDWGFELAMPSLTTRIRWRQNDTGLPIDELLGDQIRPMLEFYKALEKHRKIVDDELEEVQRTKAIGTGVESAHFEWGDFDMDGCVHKVSEAIFKANMGSSMKSPKWAVAHKFPAQSAVSRLLDVTVQVGRTGALTPVAVLEPTELGGVTIQRATLHNFDHMREVFLCSSSDSSEFVHRMPKGELVLVRRAGDVIPQVVRRIGEATGTIMVPDANSESLWISLEPPNACPACGSSVIIEEIESHSKTGTAGQVIRCGGPPLLCPPRAVASLKHAFSRDALDITGLSESRIEQLIDAGLLRYPKDVFEFRETEWESAAALPRWGEKSCRNLRETIDSVASTGVSLGRFVYSLGIRHVGKHTSEVIASSYGTVDAFLESLESQSGMKDPKMEAAADSGHPFPPLQTRLGVGPVIIASLLEFSRNDALMAAARSLAHTVRVLEQEVSSASTNTVLFEKDSNNKPWNGFTVVFTGKLDEMSRSKAQAMAKQLGAKATAGSLSKSTDLLVCGGKSGQSKLDKARDLGVATMTAEEFVEIVRRYGLLGNK